MPRKSIPNQMKMNTPLSGCALAGLRAFEAGESLSDCPGSNNRIQYRSGWLKGNMAANPDFVEIPGTLKQGENGIKYKFSTEVKCES